VLGAGSATETWNHGGRWAISHNPHSPTAESLNGLFALSGPSPSSFRVFSIGRVTGRDNPPLEINHGFKGLCVPNLCLSQHNSCASAMCGGRIRHGTEHDFSVAATGRSLPSVTAVSIRPDYLKTLSCCRHSASRNLPPAARREGGGIAVAARHSP
jgi:hypothetical protein